MKATADIFEAVSTGNLDLAKKFLNGEPALANARDTSGLSPLMQALYRRRMDIVDVLLAAGAKLDAFEAAALGRVEAVTEILDANPGTVDARSPDGFTLLHLAAFFGRDDVVGLLLERGAAANAVSQNAMSLTALHSAASCGARGIMASLLDHGADPNARQQGGWTALHAVAKHGDLEAVDMLLARGSDPAVPSDDGKTALSLATESGHQAVAERLKTNS
ncbi:MAG: ankyrin repeat domain-containing protein [Phycisphaerales bacterium]|nr:ankyrin repeat domain-containing protein [Phycisphaerales bacterium]